MEYPNELVTSTNITESDRHRLLSAERRRVVLAILAEWDSPISLEGLSRAVASHEHGEDAFEQQTVDCVKVSLHHKHLPKLAAYGVIDYDPESNWIS